MALLTNVGGIAAAEEFESISISHERALCAQRQTNVHLPASGRNNGDVRKTLRATPHTDTQKVRWGNVRSTLADGEGCHSSCLV